jgi:hypothetical protein
MTQTGNGRTGAPPRRFPAILLNAKESIIILQEDGAPAKWSLKYQTEAINSVARSLKMKSCSRMPTIVRPRSRWLQQTQHHCRVSRNGRVYGTGHLRQRSTNAGRPNAADQADGNPWLCRRIHGLRWPRIPILQRKNRRQTVLRKLVSFVAAVILSVLSSAASSAARRSIAAS